VRYFVFILCLQIPGLIFGQEDSIRKNLEKTIMWNFDIPNSLYSDSCYYTNTLLKIEVDKKSKIKFISFSDNAEDWMVKELSKVKGKLEIKMLEKLAKNNRIKKGNIVIPLVIRSGSFSCKTRTNFYWFNKSYFQFNGRNLKEKNFFLDPVEIILQSSVN
jgi:hypothetical protein